MDEKIETAEQFISKFQRSFLAYPYMIQACFGLGDKMFDAYDKLNDEETKKICLHAAKFICHGMGLELKEAQRRADD